MDPEDVRATGAVGSDAQAAAHPISVALQGLREPIVVILLLAGLFAAISGDPFQSLVLGIPAVAMAFDGDRDLVLPRPGGTIAPGARRWAFPLLGAIALYAIWVGGFARYSWPATMAVIAPGLTALALAWRGPLPGAPEPARPERRGALPWAGVLVGLSLCGSRRSAGCSAGSCARARAASAS